MGRYLIDTNVICDYFSNLLPVGAVATLDAAINAVPNLSVITQIELLCWNTELATTRMIKAFITESNIYNVSPEIIDA